MHDSELVCLSMQGQHHQKIVSNLMFYSHLKSDMVIKLFWCWRRYIPVWEVNTMPADALAPKVALAAAGIVLVVYPKGNPKVSGRFHIPRACNVEDVSLS